jgi:hypothetical protein
MSSVYGNLILDGLKKLTQALQAIEPAPNSTTVQFDDTILLKKTGVPDASNTLSSTGITIENLSGTNTQGVDFIQLEDSAGRYGLLQSDSLQIVDDTGAPESSELTTKSLQMGHQGVQNGAECNVGTDIHGHRCGIEIKTGTNTTVCTALLGFEDGAPDYPTLALQSQAINTALSIQIPQFFVGSDSLKCYNFIMEDRFFKWISGTSFRLNLNKPEVTRNFMFKVCDDGAGFTMEEYTRYLDSQGEPGWSVILCNCSSGDIGVTSPDIEFFSHATGPTGLNFPLKKWATARFTLIPTSTFSNNHAWAVSMFN